MTSVMNSPMHLCKGRQNHCCPIQGSPTMSYTYRVCGGILPYSKLLVQGNPIPGNRMPDKYRLLNSCVLIIIIIIMKALKCKPST